ncbi:hypothetical protein BAUCODRAFT_125834 [Baudoinia panamericana UAMH 10762]|uniref:RNA polymerase II degradation factor 1 n=1 Tax=Baudoinia panamericana (strain UAMH 10762) TaxID=717646 RepID=M2LFR6_BAUPA|nr:uncharacterized protein BAUCODRAFT_125834 [Baudoinia panamericana UAMH 10762]EMC92877.1 hypothetical protein BAUCODRAFT_125834 [Baudoinia panamericana UAMH 10762]
MSEVEARPPPTRGRSSMRGGRGGFGRGGPRGGRKPVNGTSTDAADDVPADELLEDQGELGEMKKKYASELGMLKDMFPDWTDVDLVFALQETDGDVAATVDKITQGNVSQFSEVKKTKDRARSKAKEEPAMAGASDKAPMRGGRGRGGFEGVRGGRGRGSDRGRGGLRGGRGGHATTNGTQKEASTVSVPTTESSAWDAPNTTETVNSGWDTAAADTTKEVAADAGQSSWGNVVTAESTPAAASEGMKSSLIPEGGPKKSWASMFAQSKPAPAAKPAQTAGQPPPAELVASGESVPTQADAVEEQNEPEPEPLPPAPAIHEPLADTASEEPTHTSAGIADGDELITPSQDPLTEENVEHLPDTSVAPATQTAASTVGSVDTRNATPLSGSQPAPIGSRPPMGGYAASAYRATGVAGRSASFQKRVLEQQEAVVMPGHNAVDRAAVQFGSMGLNGEPGPDVDEDREEPETQKMLQHSPPAQPRTSLPPAPRQAMETARPEGLPTPKQAPGLPPASQHNQQQMQEATMAPGVTQDQAQMNPNYNQYGRYAQPGMQEESGAQQQKPYDPFSHQGPPSSYDQYGTQQSQQPQQHQPQQQSHGGFGGLSSASNDYSQYYTSNDQQRQAYNQYYGSSYGPQDARSQLGQGQQDTGMAQQRSSSGFGTGPNESAYAAQAQQQVGSAMLPYLDCERQQQKANVMLAPTDLKLSDERATERVELDHKLTRLSAFTATPDGRAEGAAKAPSVPLHLRCEKLATPEQLQAEAPLVLFSDITNRQQPALLTSRAPVVCLSSSNTSTQQVQSRYGDAPGSGHNTPNPLMGGAQHQQGGPNAQQMSQHSMHQAPGSHQQQGNYGHTPGYPYGHHGYSSPYPQAYQQYVNFNHQLGGAYGGGSGGGGGSGSGSYQGKQGGGMYGAPGGYGMGSQSSFDQHSSSPANVAAFSQNQQSSMRSASGMGSGLGGAGSGLDDYGRSSVQGSAHQSSAFGGSSINDPFARSASGFGSHQGGSGYGQQQGGIGGGAGSVEDSLKPYNDSKSGPSPAPGRPGSAANSAAGSTHSGLPPSMQGHQSAGFGGYPGFPGQGGGSQYGGLGGLGSHQHQQGQSTAGMGGQGGYGGYGAGGGFSQTYGGYGSRGGWGSNYGAH